MSHQKRPSHRDAPWGVAFVLAALAVGTAYVYAGPLRHIESLPFEAPEWLLGSLALVGAAAAFGIGLRRSPSVRPLSRLGAGAAWAAGWCLLVASPWLLRYADLWRTARGLPIPPASGVTASIDPVIGDREEHFVVGFTPREPAAAVFRFYEARMARRGWKADPAMLEDHRRFHEAGLSGQTNTCFVRGRRTCVFRVNVSSPGNEPRVHVRLFAPDVEGRPARSDSGWRGLR